MKYGLMKRLVLAGIAAAMMAGTALAQDIHLTFRFNDNERDQMRAALDQFESENPGIKVDLQTISWTDARDQFLREAAVGQGPDVAHIAFVWTKEMAEAGAVMPIDELEKYGALPNGFDDFIATDLTMYQGKAYGLPWTADTWAMVYRTDVLQQAGIDQIPTTWDDLRKDSEIIKEKTGKVGFVFPAANQVWFPANYYLWSNGGNFVSEDGKGGFEVGATPEQIAADMRYFKGYIDDGLVPRSVLSIDEPQDPVLLQGLLDGSMSMAMMPTNTFRQLLSAYEDAHPGEQIPFASGVMMAGSGDPLTHLGGRTLVVNSNTKNPEAAWKLVQFLNSQQIFEKYYTNQYPAQKSLLAQIKYRPEETGFALELAKHTRTWGAYSDSGAGVGQLWNTTARAFGGVLSGQTPTEQGARDLIDQINRMISK